MRKTLFADVLEAADDLSLDAKQELIDILHKRTVEERRQELARNIKQARSEFRNGKAKAASVSDLMKDILS